MSDSLMASYLALVSAAVPNDFTDNYDYRRFGPIVEPSRQAPKLPLRRRLRWYYKRILQAFRIIDQPPVYKMDQVASATDWLRPNCENLQFLYEHLEDEVSKRLLALILAYRALGHRRVKLPLNNPDYWALFARVERSIDEAEVRDLSFHNWKIYRLKLEEFGYPFDLFIRPSGVVAQLLLQQYRCQTDRQVIEVRPGDIVVDGGGCYGDTALYLAYKAGPTGRVFSFEFLPENLSIFERNLELNPGIAARIKIVRHPMWSSSGEYLYIESAGPATRVLPAPQSPNAVRIETLSIDDLMRCEQVSRVDFIKMDIEGSELSALKGAEQSIRRFKPKLAISVYHKLADFWEIPQWIDSLGLGYRFSLRHFTIHQEETILFAYCEAPR
ncbi:FkbM family methyltransferase [uncultured Thiodictyon sp.]|jgi:FkbM family methyltransferase|uniref:FkbM family methyltransferase n=1 Tax=uncultured Thiodictyon sp. TaxID=1846217 RepID=UPI0025EB70EA|nr:FkbM family methyltransferase [uncultured Thiodictyon sp.]